MKYLDYLAMATIEGHFRLKRIRHNTKSKFHGFKTEISREAKAA